MSELLDVVLGLLLVALAMTVVISAMPSRDVVILKENLRRDWSEFTAYWERKRRGL